MSYTAEGGNFEGRSRAHGGFGNETGQTDRRGRSGEAERANRNAMSRAATLSGPRGPFKSPVYDPTIQNMVTLGKMIGPMLVSPGIGLASPLGQSILNGNVYGAFGMPRGWSSYSPRDIDPMGSNPRGNTGGRDGIWANGRLTPAQRSALLAEELQRERSRRPKARADEAAERQYIAPGTISDQVAGLPVYGTTVPGYHMAIPGYRKPAGYGGTSRPVPVAYPESYF